MIVDNDKNSQQKAREAIKTLVCGNCDVAEDTVKAFKLFKDYADIGYVYRAVFVSCQDDLLESASQIRKFEEEHKCVRTFICGLTDREDESSQFTEMDDFRNHYLGLKPVSIDGIKDIVLSRI